MLLTIGAHMSVAKGYAHMGREALGIGANTLQFFARNPRGAKARALDERDLKAFAALFGEGGLRCVVAHAPYTMNACSSDGHLRELAAEMMAGDLKVMEYFPGNFYNFHPGSHVGQGAVTAVVQIADVLNKVLYPEMRTMVLLETMAGKGTEIGRSFEELREIMNRVELSEKVGVCMDSCHMWDAGYDIAGDLEGVLKEFDSVIGLEKLKAFHLNDSLNDRGSHKDRHALLGEGKIGMEALLAIVSNPALCKLPFILETPTDMAGHAAEMQRLKELLK
ncbi:MAG: deoxyribonuclease IV [Lachnospiraceae bacterium]|nr:deoxyribonuclease IV [Lachnospiraceae bacterium]